MISRCLLPASVIALLGVGLAASPSHAAARCQDSAAATSYLSQPVDGMTAAALADHFMKKAGALQKQPAETLRQLHATIIAFESVRVPPPKAAELLAGKWDGWRAKQMSRDAYIKQFLIEAAARRKAGVPAYGATLQAAQALQNRLDTLYGAAGSRPRPEDRYRMWWWDSYLRQKAVADKVAALQALKGGSDYWDSYVLDRRATIKCVAANLKNTRVSRAVAEARRIAGEIVFPTAGYSNPKFFRAIYDGRTEGMRVTQVGFYLTAFLAMFTNADDSAAECRNVVSRATLMRIAGAGSADVLKQVFGGLARAHRKQGGSRDELFAQGFNAGAGTFGGMALSEASARADARLFYKNHGCDSRVAKHFFHNVSEFAKQK